MSGAAMAPIAVPMRKVPWGSSRFQVAPTENLLLWTVMSVFGVSAMATQTNGIDVQSSNEQLVSAKREKYRIDP